MLATCHPTSGQLGVATTSHVNPFRWRDHHRIGDFYRPYRTLYRGRTHMVVVTGVYSIVDNPGIRDLVVDINNSEGNEWGNYGYAWVTVNFFYELAQLYV